MPTAITKINRTKCKIVVAHTRSKCESHCVEGNDSNDENKNRIKKMTTSFHKTNLGSFGENLTTDLNGYVHLTAEGWMNAPMDGMAWQGYDEDAKEARCEELAAEARAATEEAEKALGEWQSE